MTYIIKTVFLLFLCVSAHFSQAQIATRISNAETPGGKTNSVRAGTLYNQATQLLDAKKYTEAIKLYEQALTADSNYVNALDNLGLAFYELEKMDSAEYYFGASLRKNPNGLAALQNMGLILESKNDPDKALEYYQKIRRSVQAMGRVSITRRGSMAAPECWIRPCLLHFRRSRSSRRQKVPISRSPTICC